ncbi:DUF4265 domain-containing protein [Larkinella sp. GY13]|uniref:DUF4265 domain-containing protein n=1 Tax=Larkinella sp. GY13 TaxID=3453720 RepID=UPI003EEF810F
MDLVKIVFECEDEEGTSLESVWATPVGENYRIENIPFFATSIAFGDIVSAKEEDGELLFGSLVEASGHSVVQIIIFDEKNVEAVMQDLVNLGCTWEGSHLPTYLALDVPPRVDYQTVQGYLEEKTTATILGYQEACLGFL